MVAIGGLAGMDTSHPGKRFFDDLAMTCLGVELCIWAIFIPFSAANSDYLPTITSLYIVLSSNRTPVDWTTRRPVAEGVF